MRYIFLSIFLVLIFINFLLINALYLSPKNDIKTPIVSAIPTPTSIPDLNPSIILSLVNDYRSSKGLSLLKTDYRICVYANTRLAEIHSDWSHDGFTKRPPFYRWYENQYLGENLAKDFITNEKVVSNWIASPSHNENLLNPYYSTTCIVTDKFDSIQYVVQEFSSGF